MIRLALLALVVAILAYSVLRWRRHRREDALARARSVFFLVKPTPPDRGPSSEQMTTVTLGEGLVRFRVPSSWEEQPTPGAFRVRASSSRVFQALVRSRRHPGVTAAALVEAFESSPEGRTGRVHSLPNDRVLLKHVRDGATGGKVGLTYCWSLAAARRPETVVVAEFSFSVPLGATDPITEDDLALLEREIQAGVFSN